MVHAPLDGTSDRTSAHRTQRRRRRRLLRMLGVGLAVYGVAGLGLLAAVAASVGGPLGELSRLSASIEGQRLSLIRALDTTERTLADAGSGIGGLDESLGRAHDSATQAAAVARGVSDTMRLVADQMGLTIFGAQPLIGLNPPFTQAAGQLTALGTSIDGIGAALAANSADITVTRDDIDELRTEVHGMAGALRDGPSLAIPAASIDGVRLVLFGLVAWLSILSLAIALLGVGLVARTRSR